MARTVDQIVRDTFGNQLLEIVRLQAENDRLQEQLGQALTAQTDQPPQSEEGRDAVSPDATGT